MKETFTCFSPSFSRKFSLKILATLVILVFGFVDVLGTTYKLTSVTSVSAGNKYVFVHDSYALTTVSDKKLQSTNSYSTTGLAGTESYVFLLENSTNGFYLKNCSLKSNQYLNNSSSTDMSNGSKSSEWKFTFTEGIALIQNYSNSDRFIGETSSSSHEFKAYATSNLSSYDHTISVYRLDEEVSCADPSAPGKDDVAGTSATITVGTSGDYNIYYSTSSDAPSKSTAGTTTISSGTSVGLTSLAYGTTYYYWAQKDCGSGSTSDYVAGSPASFTTTVPAPTGLSATPSLTGATFSITDASNINDYDIYYNTGSTAPDGNTTPTASGTSKSFAVTGLTAGTTYYYWVRAKGPNAKSTWYGGSTFATLTLSGISVSTAPTTTNYLVGENFDPTGLVITRTYTNKTSDTYTYADHTAEFSFSPATNTALTAGDDAVTITYGGETVDQSINVYTVTLNKVNMKGATISNASVIVSRSGRDLSQSVGSTNYAFDSWNVTAGGVTVSDNAITGTPTGNVTINAKFHDPIKVAWKVNNGAASGGDTEVKYNTQVGSLPTPPSDNTLSCTSKFMGWSDTNIPTATPISETSAIAALGLFTTTASSPAITQDTTFYAVFAQQSNSNGYKYIGDAGTLSNGNKYIFVNSKSAGSAYALKASDLSAPNSGNNGTAVSVTVTSNAEGILVTTVNTDLEFEYVSSGTKLKYEVSGPATRYLFINGDGVGMKSDDNRSRYTTDAGLQGWNNKATTYYDVYYNGTSGKFEKKESADSRVYAFIKQTPVYADYRVQCDPNIVKVTYNANSGSTSCANGYHDKRNDYTVCSSAPTRDYYTFTGWLCSADGEVYAASATIDDDVIDDDFTLTAQWEPISYSITYDYNGGSAQVSPAPATSFTVESSDITLQTPTKGHDRFEGWYENADLTTGGAKTTIPSGSHGNKIYYAKWATRHHIEFFKEGVSLGEMWRADDENMEDAVAGQGSVPSDPSAPTACSSKTFVGWTEDDDYDSDNKPTDLMKPAAGIVDANKEYHAVWATSTSGSKTLSFRITPSDFTGSYATGSDKTSVATATDGSGATLSVNWDYNNVMNQASKVQVKGASGAGIWCTTDLGSISSVSPSSGSASVVTYVNSTSHPASNSDTYKNYFMITNNGTFSTASSYTITFTKTISYYIAYATSCCTKYDISGASKSGTSVTVNGKTGGTLTSSHNSRCAGKNVTLSAVANTGYQFNSWTITGATSGDDLTNLLDDATSLTPAAFAMPSEGITVAADITEEVVTGWSWTYDDKEIPNPLEVYVGEKKTINVSYTPSTVINAHKSYSYVYGAGTTTYIAVNNKAMASCAIKGNKATNDETLTLKHDDDSSGDFAVVIHVKVIALPVDHYLDLVHGVEFDDQAATATDGVVTFTYTAPGSDQAEWSSSYANTCEQKKVKLVGWVESEYADACITADSFPTTDALKADGTHFFAVGATMTASNKTYYAVWAEIE